MFLEDLGNIGEFLGAMAVIASLVYLAIQIRQNTRAVKASTHQNLSDGFGDFLKLLVQDQRGAEIFRNGVHGLEGLDEAERDTFYALLSILFMHFENAHVHRQQGLMEDEQWRRWRIATGWYAGFPGVSIWWVNRRAVFGADFRAFVESESTRRGRTDPQDWSPDHAVPT